MWTLSIRLGLAEFATAFLLLAVAALLVPAFLGGWIIALVPGLTYVLAIGAAYMLYRRYRSEQAQVEPAAVAVTFRVVDVRGVCPLGRQTDDVVTVDLAGSAAPLLCPPAEAMLRLAAAEEEGESNQWCCPIFDHLLVFQREVQAA